MAGDFWSKRKIFPSITTITKSGWRKKMEEVKKFGLKEVCLFLTCLEEKERKDVYRELKKTKVERIPLIHLRSDMKEGELDFLSKNYKTEVFNTHSEKKYPLLYNLGKYQKKIYIENTGVFLDENEIEKFAGVCLDFSHLENDRLLSPEKYKNEIKIIEKSFFGCNHLSAIRKKPAEIKDEKEERLSHDSHYLNDLSEMDYLKKFPAKYFSSICALELEDTIEKQLEVREYVIELLKEKI